jgi:hypothetical protein
MRTDHIFDVTNAPQEILQEFAKIKVQTIPDKLYYDMGKRGI